MVSGATEGVKFGIGFYNTQSTYVRPLRHPYLFREAVAEARRAEELGFDSWWLGEHHFSYDGYTPATIPALTYLASATNRLAVGAGVMLFPMRPPGEVARQCAAFQGVTPSRLRLAMAVGYSAMEFKSHRVDIHRRGKIIERYLEQLTTEFADEFAGTELWMGGTVPVVFQRAGRFGASLLLGENIGPDALREIRGIWEAELKPRPGQKPTIAVHREVWADDDKQRAEWVRARLRESWKVYTIYFEDPKPWEFLGGMDREGWIDAMMSLAVIGCPDEVVDNLGKLIEAGAEEIVFRVRYDGTPHGQVLTNLERLASDVIPQLRTVSSREN